MDFTTAGGQTLCEADRLARIMVCPRVAVELQLVGGMIAGTVGVTIAIRVIVKFIASGLRNGRGDRPFAKSIDAPESWSVPGLPRTCSQWSA